MNEDELREKLYDVTEDFYSMLSSNEPVNVSDELDKFINILDNITESRKQESDDNDLSYDSTTRMRIACDHRSFGMDDFIYENGICTCKMCGVKFKSIPLSCNYEDMRIRLTNEEYSVLDILENFRLRAIGNNKLLKEIKELLKLYYQEKEVKFDRELYDKTYRNIKARLASTQELYEAASLLKNHCMTTNCGSCWFFIKEGNKCKLLTKPDFNFNTVPRDWDI